MSISTSGFRGLLLAQIAPVRGRTTSRPLRFLLWQKSPHFRGLSVTTKSPPRQASQAGSCHHACLHRCHRAHTRTWHGTALCSSIIGTLPREPMAASGQVYPKLQRNLLDERYIHDVTARGDASVFFAVSERANPERLRRYARALRS